MKWKVENWQFYILVLVNARSIMIQYILIVANGVLVHICINDLLCMQYRKVENYTKNDMIELWGSPRIHRPALSYYNITIYICILYEWYIQKLNCSDNDRVWTKVFFSNFFHFWRVVNKSEFFFQISIIFLGHYMVMLLDMIVLNHIVTLIMMFEEGVAAKHGK